jgi:hypothetical protein
MLTAQGEGGWVPVTPTWFLVVQTIVSVAIVLTFIVYFLQLRAMRHATKSQTTFMLIQYLQSPAIRDARRVLIKELSAKPYKDWVDAEKDMAETAINPYEVAGILVANRLVLEDVIVDNWSPTIAKCHEATQLLIAEARTSSRPNAWQNFDDLARRSSSK